MLLLGCLHGSTESNLSARWGWERTAKEQMAPPSYSQYWLANHWLPRWHCDKELPCYCRRNKRPGLDPWIGKISWRRKWQPAPVFFIPGSKRYPGGGNGNLLQYSCLRKPTDRGAWQAMDHSVPKSWRTEANWQACMHHIWSALKIIYMEIISLISSEIFSKIFNLPSLYIYKMVPHGFTVKIKWDNSTQCLASYQVQNKWSNHISFY